MVIHHYFVKLDHTSAFERNNEKVALTEIFTTYAYPETVLATQIWYLSHEMF